MRNGQSDIMLFIPDRGVSGGSDSCTPLSPETRPAGSRTRLCDGHGSKGHNATPLTTMEDVRRWAGGTAESNETV